MHLHIVMPASAAVRVIPGSISRSIQQNRSCSFKATSMLMFLFFRQHQATWKPDRGEKLYTQAPLVSSPAAKAVMLGQA